MNKKTKCIICGSTTALALLMGASAPHIGQEPITQPHARPVSAITQEYRVLTPPALASKETTNPVLDSTPPTGIAFEPQKPNAVSEILTTKEPPRDKPTPEPLPSKNTARVTATEPQMGDTRIVDGQNQVYFLGFGWIEDNDTPNECVYVEDMYENGNKIGSMGGGEVGRSCGDINKMVGTMD